VRPCYVSICVYVTGDAAAGAAPVDLGAGAVHSTIVEWTAPQLWMGQGQVLLL
jgi:hypothetical protein